MVYSDFMDMVRAGDTEGIEAWVRRASTRGRTTRRTSSTARCSRRRARVQAALPAAGDRERRQRRLGVSDLLVIGISHKTAPVELRERVALPEGRAAGVLRELVSTEHIHEAVALSTCNRTELYLAVGDDVEAETAALGILARQADIRPTELVSHLYSLRNADAARHLFRVTAGLDAMIVGETEIQGQVKRAYELALVESTTSAFMNRLFREALAAGKRVRTETAIGVGSRVRQLRRGPARAGDARRPERPAGGHHRRRRDRRADRAGADRARRLVGVRRQPPLRPRDRPRPALRRACRALRALPAELERADIVVSSTGSPHHIIERAELEAVMAARGGRPLLLIDIAVPRDIDPAVREIEGVHLRDIDDLQRVVERNLSGREAEARRAEALIEHELERFKRWLGTLEVVPTIAALHERGEAIARQVLAENSGRWESLSEADRERLELLAATIVKRLLHQPTLHLKDTRRRPAHLRVRAGAARAVRAGRARARRHSTPAARAMRSTGRRAGAEVTADSIQATPPAALKHRSGSARAAARWRSPRRGTVADAAARRHGDVEPELVPIMTCGIDRRRRPDDKSRFVKEIEEALLRGEIDLAVHSAKDVPGELARGTRDRRACPPARTRATRSVGARVARRPCRRARAWARRACGAGRSCWRSAPTSSRAAARQRRHPPAQAGGGRYDAIVLALAGLRRLGREDEAGAVLDADDVRAGARPGAACARGADRDERPREPLRAIDGPSSRARGSRPSARWWRRSTRAATRRSASHASIAGEQIEVRAYAGLPDGSDWITDRSSASGDPSAGRCRSWVARTDAERRRGRAACAERTVRSAHEPEARDRLSRRRRAGRPRARDHARARPDRARGRDRLRPAGAVARCSTAPAPTPSCLRRQGARRARHEPGRDQPAARRARDAREARSCA